VFVPNDAPGLIPSLFCQVVGDKNELLERLGLREITR
jgi:hypothetical protein